MKTENIPEQNKQVVRQAIEVIWNKGDYEKLEQFVTSDFIVHSANPDEDIHGPEGAKQFYIQLRNAFPDIQFVIEDQIAEGDKVVTHWKAHGTHSGSFMGIPPSGRRFSVTAIDIDRIVDGKVAECWTKMDELGLLQQLGAIPMAEHSS